MANFWWRFEDHVCAQCLGRIVSRRADDGRPIARCSSCGTEAVGQASTICVCGVRRGPYAKLRCIRIDHALPGVMAQVVASEVDDGR